MTSQVADDASIEDDDIALRRVFDAHKINFVKVDAVTHERRASSAAFRFDDDGMSVYLNSILQQRNLDAQAVITQPFNAVAGVTVRSIRQLQIGITRDPYPASEPDPTHVRHAAHCLITVAAGRSNNDVRKLCQALARKSHLMVDPGKP